MSVVYYCSLAAGVEFEGDTRAQLIAKVADHFAEGYAGPDEDPSPPEYAEFGTFTSDGDGGEVMVAVGPTELKQFNDAVAEAFAEAIEGWDDPSDRDEHGTHWGLK